jgi:hypothetical protein
MQYNRRQSAGFVNDYTASAQSNIAPAATESPEAMKIRSTAMQQPASGFLQSKKPVESIGAKPSDEWAAPFTKLSRHFLRRAKDKKPSISPPRTRPLKSPRQAFSHSIPPPALPKKKSEGKSAKEKRRIFQKLCDEKLPDYPKARHRKGKSDYIKNKFGAMDFHQSDQTVNTTDTSVSLGGSFSKVPSPADILGNEDEFDDDFVNGLIFFAPTSENEIRDLVAKPAAAV